MHQTLGIFTVFQVKKVPQFMERYLGGPFVQAGEGGRWRLQVLPQSLKRDDRMPAALPCFAVNMFENRYKDIDTQNAHDFQTVMGGYGFNGF